MDNIKVKKQIVVSADDFLNIMFDSGEAAIDILGPSSIMAVSLMETILHKKLAPQISDDDLEKVVRDRQKTRIKDMITKMVEDVNDGKQDSE